MSEKSIFGSSVSMSNEFNFKGKKTEVKSRGKACTPVKMSDRNPPADAAPFVPLIMGALPLCSGLKNLSPIEQAVMGAVGVAGTIRITQDPETAKYMLGYILSLLKVVNGASAQNGRLSEEELKKLLMSLISKWLEESGPGFSSYREILQDLMQNAALQDLMKGMQDVICAMTGDPVNANTGNFIYEKEDLTIKGRTPLCFKRFYNSTDKRTGSMGNGWRHNYEIQLLVEKDRYTILWGDGREEVYLRDKENGPQPLFGLPCRLRRENEKYLYETQEKMVFTFDKEGRLVTQEDPNGQGIRFTYDKNGRLASVRSSSKSSLYYEYDSLCGLLCSVSDHTGRRVALTYELGRLKEVKNTSGQSYLYTYDSDKKISKIRNPRGVYVLENSYDGKGRTTLQKFADGGEIRYDYQEDLNRTLVTEQNGNKVAYVHDERYRNVKTVYVDGEERFTYNDRNQLVSKTDKNGNRTKFSYDDKGNTAQILYPDGARHNMTYDADNHLITLSVNGTNKLKNIYNKKGNLIKTTDALGRCHTISYDETGKAVNLTQPDQSTVTIDYDSHDNIISLTDGAGNTTAYQYDDLNRVIRMTDANGFSTRYAYDEADQLIGITNAAGYSRRFQYTKNGKLSKVKDYNGAETLWDYNCMNKVEAITLPDGGSAQLEYDKMQNVIEKKLPNGSKITYSYDPLGHLEQTTLPNGGIIRYEYDPNGNQTAITDPNGARTEYDYDEQNRVIKTTGPDGAVTEYEYDIESRLTRVTSAAGILLRAYVYDEAGQLISETDSRQNTTRYEYTALGKLAARRGPNGRDTIYTYAPGGLLIKTATNDGTSETYTYDKNGNLISRKNQKGEILTYAYDCLNQLISMTSSYGQKKNFTYNASGAVTSVTDTLGHITHYDYTPGGNLNSVLDAAGNRTEYAYNSMGELITICQHEGNAVLLPQSPEAQAGIQIQLTHYKRGLMGQIEAVTNALGLEERFAYDMSGKLISKTDRDGYETRYGYTPSGSLEQITYADGRTIAYTYNPLRQLIQIKDWLGTTKIEPDKQGRVRSITDYKGRTLTYQYDQNGKRTALIYPDGTKTAYHYDEQDRLFKLTDHSGEITYCYNEEGGLSEKIYPNKVVSRYKYNPMGLLASITHQKDGEVLEQYQYQYDLMGNKTAIQKRRSTDIQEPGIPQKLREENGCYQYRYDSLNRLTQVQKDRVTLRQYDYDAFGNRIRQTSEQGTTRYYYNQANQLIRTEGAGPEQNCQYDNRGNLTAILQGTKVFNQYHYDETNRLTLASSQNGQAARYQYDGLGNRVGSQEYRIQDLDQTGNPVREIEYLLDLTKQYHNLLEQCETIGENKATQRYTWDSNVVFLSEGETKQIYLQDELGSPVRLIGMEKKQQTVYGYDEFGQDLYNNQGEVQPFGYTGYRKDAIANTYFAQAREYLPQAGRFGGKDLHEGSMMHPDSLHKYNYCWNNPINYIDLTGRVPTKSNFVGPQSERAMPSDATYDPTQEDEALKAYNQQRIDFPAPVFPDDPTGLPDYTDQVNDWLDGYEKRFHNSIHNFGYTYTTIQFYNAVKTGGPMDIKQEKAWKEAFGTDLPNFLIYNGEIMDPGTLGNITYGYIGASVGYEDKILFYGGGFANLKNLDNGKYLSDIFRLPNYGDAPEDIKRIQQGIDLYKNKCESSR